MTRNPNGDGAGRLSRLFLALGIALAACGLASVALALTVPIDHGPGEGVRARPRGGFDWPREEPNLDPLLRQMAGRRVIRPPQIRAAVKDTGEAARLAKRLRLEGVVRIGSDLVAYIRVNKESLATVRQGSKVLDFVVERVEPGKVTLSLEGVEAVLTH